MKSFLQAVAAGYVREKGTDLSSHTFVFPSRRAAYVFLNNVRRELFDSGRHIPAPQVISLSQLVEEMSGRVVDNRIDLLFLLYGAYCSVMRSRKLEPREFNNFRSMGETLLNDFDEIDSYLVDPEALFGNINDLNSIATDFLTDAQKEVLREYFGEEFADSEQQQTERKYFWEHCRGDNPVAKSYKSLWALLYPIYEEFNKRLADEGLAYMGLAERLAADSPVDVDCGKLVFVGFNRPNPAQWLIFKHLRGKRAINPDVEFVWDLFGNSQGDDLTESTEAVARCKAFFPSPAWIDKYLKAANPTNHGIPDDIRVVACSSATAQAKIVGKELSSLDISGRRVAVVLPDESLLSSVITSLPPGLPSVNLTIGYSLRLTPVASFVGCLRRLQGRGRKRGNDDTFFYEDVKSFLSHPLARTILDSMLISKVLGKINAKRLYNITRSDFLSCGCDDALSIKVVDKIFRLLPGDATADATLGYVDDALSLLRFESPEPNRDETDTGEEQGNPLLVRQLMKYEYEAYRHAVARLIATMHDRDLSKVPPLTVFVFLDRLIREEKVMFEGKPYSGLQILGIGDTYALDFDHLIIPSMNEKVYPRSHRRSSMIAEVIRIGYRMPSLVDYDSSETYNFYRLISRAKSLTLIYDSREGGLKTSEPSRFVRQLQLLYAPKKTKAFVHSYASSVFDRKSIVVNKEGSIMDRLLKFCEKDSGRRFSASLLLKYFNCPMQFCFTSLLNLDVVNEPSEFLTADQQGTLMHEALCRYYAKGHEEGILYTEPLNPPDADVNIEDYLREAMNRLYLHKPEKSALTGAAALQADVMGHILRRFLKKDRVKGLRIHGLEFEHETRVPFKSIDGKDMMANFVMFIDRMDEVQDRSGKKILRVIDYKTGNAHVEAGASPDDVFNGNYKAKHIFQLLLYSMLLKDIPGWNSRPVKSLIKEVTTGKECLPNIGKETVDDNSTLITFIERNDAGDEIEKKMSVKDWFEQRLREELTDLFNPDKPFEQCVDATRCEYCTFKNLCQR